MCQARPQGWKLLNSSSIMAEAVQLPLSLRWDMMFHGKKKSQLIYYGETKAINNYHLIHKSTHELF